MAKDKKSITDKSDKDLSKLLIEKRDSLRDFYYGVAGGKVTNTKSGRNVKKDIARVLTELRKRRTQGKVEASTKESENEVKAK